MHPKSVQKPEQLTHQLCTRVGNEKYQELQKLLAGNPGNDMSRMLRDILHNREIKVLTVDKTIHELLDELRKIRSELRAIGVNINQITRQFNTYPEPERKVFFARIAFDRYALLNRNYDQLFIVVSKIEKKWLSE